MHDLLFEHKQSLGLEAMHRHARNVGLDGACCKADMQAYVFAARVQEEFASGIRSGVNGTPTGRRR